MRKMNLLMILVSIMLFSCSEEAAVTESEALRLKALKSVEFQAVKSAYAEYQKYKMEEITSIANQIQGGLISEEEAEAKKQAYYEKMGQMFLKVAKANKGFCEAHPEAAKDLPAPVLLQTVRKELEL